MFSANRVAAIATFLSGLGALVVGSVGVFPQSWQNFALAAGGLLTKATIGWKFLHGSQKYDALQAAKAAPVDPARQAAVQDLITHFVQTTPAAPDPEAIPDDQELASVPTEAEAA